jgi:GT2 family glycosyltransferase
MNLHLAIISCIPELFMDAASHAARVSSRRDKTVLLGIGNGCQLHAPDVGPSGFDRYLTGTFSENRGVPAALHELWTMSHQIPGDDDAVLCYIHDDLRILETEWDERVLRAFDRDPKIGLATFGGSTGIGVSYIYQQPYNCGQLGRSDFYSNMNGAEVHGVRTTEERPVVWGDGQSMIVRRSMLDKVEGWSWYPFDAVHHGYDYAIACMTRRLGYTGWLVPCAIEHRGGLTACSAIYQTELSPKYGGDAAVHDRAHRFVYEEFRDVLPLRL